jgi:hypothetical protein
VPVRPQPAAAPGTEAQQAVVLVRAQPAVAVLRAAAVLAEEAAEEISSLMPSISAKLA